jgi:hypothetical protein
VKLDLGLIGYVGLKRMFGANALACAMPRDGSGIFCMSESINVEADLPKPCEQKPRIGAGYSSDRSQTNLMETRLRLGACAPASPLKAVQASTTALCHRPRRISGCLRHASPPPPSEIQLKPTLWHDTFGHRKSLPEGRTK